jgi:hypothetical protein
MELDLDEQLRRDVTGELRDKLVAELRTAASDIEAALERRPAPEQAEILRGLLGAVGLSECVLMEAWISLHG